MIMCVLIVHYTLFSSSSKNTCKRSISNVLLISMRQQLHNIERTSMAVPLNGRITANLKKTVEVAHLVAGFELANRYVRVAGREFRFIIKTKASSAELRLGTTQIASINFHHDCEVGGRRYEDLRRY